MSTTRNARTTARPTVATLSAEVERLTTLVAALVDAQAPAKVTPVKAETPAWIIEHAQRKQARRALAASLRAQGIEPTGAAWTKAKKAAGLA